MGRDFRPTPYYYVACSYQILRVTAVEIGRDEDSAQTVEVERVGSTLVWKKDREI